MGAQSELNSLSGTVISGVGSAFSVGKGIDSEMAKKAKEALKAKLAVRKQLNKQAANRMKKVGGVR